MREKPHTRAASEYKTQAASDAVHSLPSDESTNPRMVARTQNRPVLSPLPGPNLSPPIRCRSAPYLLPRRLTSVRQRSRQRRANLTLWCVRRLFRLKQYSIAGPALHALARYTHDHVPNCVPCTIYIYICTSQPVPYESYTFTYTLSAPTPSIQ